MPYPTLLVTLDTTVVYAEALATFFPEKSEKKLVSELPKPLTWQTCPKYAEQAALAAVLGEVKTKPSIGS